MMGDDRLAERALLPPREVGRHAGADLHREAGRPLLEEGDHAFLDVFRLAARIDALGIDLVGLHRVVGTEHAPEHVPGEGHRYRCGVVCDLACERGDVGLRDAGDRALRGAFFTETAARRARLQHALERFGALHDCRSAAPGVGQFNRVRTGRTRHDDPVAGSTADEAGGLGQRLGAENPGTVGAEGRGEHRRHRRLHQESRHGQPGPGNAARRRPETQASSRLLPHLGRRVRKSATRDETPLHYCALIDLRYLRTFILDI